ncbi:MAG: hypothetical protein M3Y31_01410 [Gemmatimonadota bacterium]|nr:hypothetical protein [Gemmatimonadota bacterium]
MTHGQTTNTGGACSYELDSDLRISSVDTGWSEFASTNAAPQLAAPAPVGQPLFSYIRDLTTVHLYRRLFDRVARTEQPVTFTFRCDAPALRRLLEMEIRPGAIAGLRLQTRVVRLEPRVRVALLDPLIARTGAALRMCSWCKAVDADGRWCEVEEAVAHLRLFERERLPDITHGICPPCEARIEALLD